MAAVAAVVAVGGVLVVLLVARPSDPGSAADPPDPIDADRTPGPAPAMVETTRTTTVDGGVVTVEEVSTVVTDATTVAQPSRATPTGLRLVDLAVSGQDGRSTPFTQPLDVAAGGSLSVTALYRLTDCPDVLPALWPSPTRFPEATQTYPRLDQPQHTASALCPERRSRSQTLTGLQADLAPGAGVRVRLTWNGEDTLSISGIGSASGIAAIPARRSASCGSDVSCVAILDAVAPPGVTRSAILSLEPVDPCPPGTESDRLVLLVSGGSSAPRPVSVPVDDLHRSVCRS
jgi:hypothetical protein